MIKKEFFYLILAVTVILPIISGCEELEDGPDFEVHTVAYNNKAVLYQNNENTIYLTPSGTGLTYCKNCKPIYYGDIIKATPEEIEIEAANDYPTDALPIYSMNPNVGYIMKATWKSGTGSYKESKDFYFYLYFSDFHYSESSLGYYNPKSIHYQRFK